MVPGFVLLALGLGELIEDLALIKPAHQDVPGLSATALAIAFLVIWVVARLGNRRWIWPLWAAAIFGVIGIPQLATLVVLPEIGGALVPVVIIVLGFIVLFNWRRERAVAEEDFRLFRVDARWIELLADQSELVGRRRGRFGQVGQTRRGSQPIASRTCSRLTPGCRDRAAARRRAGW